MIKNENTITATKAKWEAPEIVSVGAGLSDVASATAAGTDSLQFGSSTSMS